MSRAAAEAEALDMEQRPTIKKQDRSAMSNARQVNLQEFPITIDTIVLPWTTASSEPEFAALKRAALKGIQATAAGRLAQAFTWESALVLRALYPELVARART